MSITYVCPLNVNGCEWCGDKIEILNHFDENHIENLTYTSEISIDILKDLNTKYTLMHYLNRTYLIQTCIKLNEFNVKSLIIKLRLLGTYEEAAAHSYYVEIMCGTFSFNRNNSNIITLNNGSIIIDLHHVSLLTSFNRLIKINFVFDKLPRNYIYNKYNEKNINDDNDGDDDDDNDFAINAVKNDFNSKETSCDIVETKNDRIREETIEEEENEIDDSSVHLRRRNSRRFSWKSENRRRSSTTDIDAITFEHQRNTSLLLSLVCDFCKQYVTPPIYKCHNTHVCCIFCKTNYCLECKTIFKRDDILEDIAKNVLYPCKFSHCNEKSLKLANLSSHEIMCYYANYECPLCDEYIGNYNNFVKHMNKHNVALYDKLTNPFPEDTTFIIANEKSGIFLCSSLHHNTIVEYKVIFCGRFKIFIECVIVFMGKIEYKYSLYRQKWDSFTTSISTRDLKTNGLKAKNALLVINTTPTKLLMS